jgi:hypothetical protein
MVQSLRFGDKSRKINESEIILEFYWKRPINSAYKGTKKEAGSFET